MKPIKTAACNLALTAPPGWDAAVNGPCGTLHVAADPASLEYISYWKPSEEDIKSIVAGAAIRLNIVGFQPPVWIDVDPDGMTEIP